MAYNLLKSNGDPLVTVEDGTVNETATSLSLIGKNFAGFGPLLNENFIYLLEHFANSNEPNNPVPGQIWYDTGAKVLKIRTTTNVWKLVAAVTADSASPNNPAVGDQWWDTANQQLFSWTGTEWLLIGPLFSSNQDVTGAIPSLIRDNVGVDHVVIKFYVNNVVVGIWSKDLESYTVDSGKRVPGFFVGTGDQVVKPGLTLADLGTYDAEGYTEIPRNMIWGTIERSLNVGSTSFSSYLRKDDTGEVQSVADTVQFDNSRAVIMAGNITAADSELYNIGEPDGKFANIYIKNIVADSVYSDNHLFANGSPISIMGTVGYTGSAGAGYTGSAGSIDYSTFDRTSIGATAMLVSPWMAKGSITLASSNSNITGYTYAAGIAMVNSVAFNDPGSFTTPTNLLLPAQGGGTFNYRKAYHPPSLIKGPTLAPGTWKIINPCVATTDVELTSGGYNVQQAQDTGIYAVVYAVRIL